MNNQILTTQEIADRAMERMKILYSPMIGFVKKDGASYAVQQKCLSCGSHEYRDKVGIRVCSYCRTPG